MRPEWNLAYTTYGKFSDLFGTLFASYFNDIWKWFDIGSMFIKLGDFYTNTYNIIVEVPARALAFWNVGYEVYDFGLFIVKHWNVVGDGAVVSVNLSADWYHIVSNIYGIFSSTYSSDFYKAAKNFGELVPVILN